MTHKDEEERSSSKIQPTDEMMHDTLLKRSDFVQKYSTQNNSSQNVCWAKM